MKRNAKDYHVGWICALPLELAAAKGMLDEIHDRLTLPAHDQNQYSYGQIGPHNIVIACLPAGNTGTAAAARVASHLHASFSSLRLALLVGIGGGVPGPDFNIRLGDVVVSQPSGTFGGVVQYTFGKTVQDGAFRRTGFSNSPPQVLLAAVSELQSKHFMEGHEITRNLSRLFEMFPTMASTFKSPGRGSDDLYQADYDHPAGEKDCTNCDKLKLVPRQQRSSDDVVIHYGNIASGDQVMRHGLTRDCKSEEFDVKCFEMEAAGLMNNYPCIVIRGISDYADSHKNKQWQNYAAATAAAYARELVQTIPQQEVIKTCCVATEISGQDKRRYEVIPRETVESYIDRPELSSELEEKLHTRHDEHDPPNSLAVYGLGGCGKSQLVLKYIEKHKENFVAIFWINAEDEKTTLNSFQRIAEKLQLPKSNQERPSVGNIWETDVVQSVLDWLQNRESGKWLVVIDNANDLSWRVRDLIPKGNSGAVIVTSRNDRSHELFARKSATVHVDKLNEEEAVELLLKDHPEKNKISSKENDATLSIVQKLGRFALALDLARASLEYSTYPRQALQRYFKQLSRHFDEVLEDDNLSGLLPYEKTIKTVWDVSFAAVREKSNVAANLLAFLSFFDPSSIEDELFRVASSGLHSMSTEKPGAETIFPDWLQGLLVYDDGWDDFKYQKAIQLLRMHSLVQPTSDEWPGVTMHSLVQWRAKISISDQRDETIWNEYLERFLTAAAFQSLRMPPHSRRYLLSHLRRVPESSTEERSERSFKNDLRMHMVDIFSSEGLWSEAEPLDIQLFEIIKQQFGLEHNYGLTAMSRLLRIYFFQTKLDKTEQLIRQVLHSCKEKLGPNHHKTVWCMGSLASTYLTQNRLSEAERLHSEALQICKTEFGPNHHDTLTHMNTLAIIHLIQGKQCEAERVQIQVVFGQFLLKDPDFLKHMSLLAMIYRCSGKRDEAELLHLEVLRISKMHLGSDHLQTLLSTIFLAEIYQHQGKQNKVEELLINALEIQKTRLGPNDSRTLLSMWNVARAYWMNQKSEKALSLLRETRDRMQVVLGDSHANVMRINDELAACIGGRAIKQPLEGISWEAHVSKQSRKGQCEEL